MNSPQERERGPRPDSGETEPADPWALRVATVSRIPIRLHFTFLLLVIWLAAAGIGRGGAYQVLFVIAVFACVVLHELGHSLVAQRYGYTVRDIVLYPIGGVAAIEQTPKPRHELYIALAGPAVNVVIAAVIAGGIYLLEGSSGFAARFEFLKAAPTGFFSGGFLTLLLGVNILLVLFNMIPAFPMDGGRVLRALLALRIGRLRATRIAAFIGRVVAVVMGAAGLGIFNNGVVNPSLLLIALFVFFGAGQEAQAEESREIVDNAPIRDAMVREFTTLSVGDTLRQAAETLLATTQQDFPVLHGDEVAGVLSRSALLRGLAEHGDTAYVAGEMEREILFAQPEDPLEEYLMRPDGVQRAPVLVRDESGALVGMLTLDNLMEYLTLRRIYRDRAEQTGDPGRRAA